MSHYGKATKPLRLPIKAPACFDSQKQWELYRETAVYSAGDGFTFCTDCVAGRKAEMVAAGRCKYPGTVFIKLAGGVTVGRRRK